MSVVAAGAQNLATAPLSRRPLRPDPADEKPPALALRRLGAGADGVGGFWGIRNEGFSALGRSGFAVGAAPCGRPLGVIGGEAPYTEKGLWVGIDISPEGE